MLPVGFKRLNKGKWYRWLYKERTADSKQNSTKDKHEML